MTALPLLITSATCDSSSLTGSFCVGMVVAAQQLLYFVQGYQREKMWTKDEQKQVTVKTTVPSAFWNLCCYGENVL